MVVVGFALAAVIVVCGGLAIRALVQVLRMEEPRDE